MNHKTFGIYMMCVGVFSLVLAYIIFELASQTSGTTDEETLEEAIVLGLTIGCPVLILSGTKWYVRINPEKSGGRMSGLHYVSSLIILYVSACIFGSTVMLTALQFTGGGEPPTDMLALLLVVIAVSFVTTAFLRHMMRDGLIIEGYGWDEERVLKSTGLFRVFIAMILPLLIILVIMAVIFYFLLSAAATKNYCPDCGKPLDSNNVCRSCRKKYYF